MLDNINARLVFDNARNLLMSLGKDVTTARLTQGTIRSEVLLSTATASYPIQTLVNQNNNAGTIFNTEIRLAQQDWFITSSIGVFLAVPGSTVDAAFKLLTYPDLSYLTIGVANAVYALYNSKLSLTIDNNVVMPEWDVQRHLYIPTQQAAANSGYTGSGITYLGGINGSDSGFYPVEPNLIFNGAANLDFRLNLPAAFTAIPVSGFGRIVVIQRGIKAQNVSSVK